MLKLSRYEKFSTLQSLVMPLDCANVDTDQIIPKQFLRSIHRTGFGQFLFDEWRYLDQGQLGMDCSTRPLNDDFVLNNSRYKNAKILLARDNFGCGSSREHAVWALMEYGFLAIIAPSFGDIFANNAYKNGLLSIALEAKAIDELFNDALHDPHVVDINLSQQTVCHADATWSFNITPENKKRLQEGLDDIAITLQYKQAIQNFEKQRRQSEPWIFSQTPLSK